MSTPSAKTRQLSLPEVLREGFSGISVQVQTVKWVTQTHHAKPPSLVQEDHGKAPTNWRHPELTYQ